VYSDRLISTQVYSDGLIGTERYSDTHQYTCVQ